MAPLDRYRDTRDLPTEIPVFPLRGVIVLPRSELPLNIFEPRYLDMIDDVLSNNRVLGIIQPEQTAIEVESPEGKASPLKAIGCCGRLTAYQELTDGRMHIVLTGIARFEVLREVQTTRPYRIANVSYDQFAADLQPDQTEPQVDRDGLMAVLKSYLAVSRLEADWNAIARAPLEPLVNGLSAMSPFGPEEKQALLEAVDLKSRAQVLTALAEMSIAAGGSSGASTLQ